MSQRRTAPNLWTGQSNSRIHGPARSVQCAHYHSQSERAGVDAAELKTERNKILLVDFSTAGAATESTVRASKNEPNVHTN
jgi:hypothetical protein